MQITLTGGLTDDVGVIGKIGDELWPIAFVLRPLCVFDAADALLPVLLLLLLLWWDNELLLFAVFDGVVVFWPCFDDDVDVVAPFDEPDDEDMPDLLLEN